MKLIVFAFDKNKHEMQINVENSSRSPLTRFQFTVIHFTYNIKVYICYSIRNDELFISAKKVSPVQAPTLLWSMIA